MDEIVPIPGRHRNDAVAVSVPAHSSRLDASDALFSSANRAIKGLVFALTLFVVHLSAYFSDISYTVTLSVMVCCVFGVVSSDFHSKFNCALNLQGKSDVSSGSKFWHSVKRRERTEGMVELLKSQPVKRRHVYV